jgi:hypothetical protein
MSREEDYINTNLLDSDNTGVKIAQDLIISTVIDGLIIDSATGAIYHMGGKQALQATFGRYDVLFTKEMFERLSKASSQKITGTVSQQLGKMFAKKSAQRVLSTLGRSAASAAARSGTVAAGGCTIGPAGCAAGAVIGGMLFIADLSFSVFTLIQDLEDKTGILHVFHKKEVEAIAKDFEDSLDAGYEAMGYPDLMNEEVLFYPENFVYDYDRDTNTITMNPDNEWVEKYIQYRNEYIRDQGIEDGWEDRLVSQQLNPVTDFLNIPDDVSKNILPIVSSSVSCITLIILFSILLV